MIRVLVAAVKNTKNAVENSMRRFRPEFAVMGTDDILLRIQNLDARADIKRGTEDI